MMTPAPAHSGNPDTCPVCVSFRSRRIAPDPGVSVPEFIDARDALSDEIRDGYGVDEAKGAAEDVLLTLIALGWRKVAEPES